MTQEIDLGQFSQSLNVKNLNISLAFYLTLGFKVIDGGHTNQSFKDTESTKWRVLKSGETVIGLFQGMFPKNVMTFNPKDVRNIQQRLKAMGVTLIKEANENTTGPESIVFLDPDGNQILMDQHL